MTVQFVADAETTVGTAGTSVAVNRPTGTAAGHVLVALIAAVTDTSISTPSGWTLIGTQVASTSVRLSAYRRLADGTEPASWTWTLGSSQRAIGWVAAYSGVDPATPIESAVSTTDTSAGTSWATGTATMTRPEARLVTVAAVTRTASGAATTMTGFDIERADLSTNGGSGTDIAACVNDGSGEAVVNAPFNTFTTSQSCAAGVMWAITLRPAFAAYNGGRIPITLEAAWGADPDGDQAEWVWSPLTGVQVDTGITIEGGLGPEGQPVGVVAPPTHVSFTLRNGDGRYTPDNPLSPLYPHVVSDVPLRMTLPYGYAPPTQRFLVYAESWDPDWDESTRKAIVRVEAYGRLQREQSLNRPVQSALRRALSGILPGPNRIRVQGYWPAEDGADAVRVASAFDERPALVTGAWSPASASDCPGSAPLPTLAADSRIQGYVRPYVGTGRWAALAVVKLPTTPVAATSPILRVLCTGSAPYWHLELSPGSPDTLHLRAFLDSDTSLLDSAIAIDEADVYGKWIMLAISVVQSGSNIDYRGSYYTPKTSSSTTGTLNSRTVGVAREVRVDATTSTDGIAVGHLTAISSALLDPSAHLNYIAFTALDGQTGDLPAVRFNDLVQIANVPADTAGVYDGPAMGPLTPTTFDQALTECAATDQALIHDAAPSGEVTMVTRVERYNQPVTMEVDVSAAELAPPFGPTYSARDRVSDSTVSRAGGSSARVVNTDVQGARAEQVTLSLETDRHLVEIAGFRARLLSWPGMRYPALAVNLRRTPGLVAQWLECRIGSRITATNLWDSHGPSSVDQVVNGFTERISKDRWTVTLHCSPAAPYDVAVLEATDDSVFRAEPESELATPASTSATTLSVASTGALLTAAPSNYPVDLDVGGEQIGADACGTILNLNPWLLTALTNWIGSNSVISRVTSPQLHPAYGSIQVNPTGGGTSGGTNQNTLVAVSPSTQYIATCWVYTTQTISIGPAVDWHTGAGAFISNGFVAPTSVAAGTWTLLTGTLTSPATAGQARMRARHETTTPAGALWYVTGITLIPVSSTTASPQTLTVRRAINGAVLAHDAGTPVRIWRGRGIAL